MAMSGDQTQRAAGPLQHCVRRAARRFQSTELRCKIEAEFYVESRCILLKLIILYLRNFVKDLIYVS